MSDVAIKIENLGKRYRYGGPAAVSYNLRQDLTDWMKGMFRRQHFNASTQPINMPHHSTLHEVQEKHRAESPEYFWALKDINLEIKQGEVVGIIGRNGAGKSTLLKILSRIAPPTTGKITHNGRMASLLEVGTGFHRELTGRENIFLNGSILGMKRSEITKKFDEIVTFAEVEKFIDTPVKFYSSGMYVRLAFAVAAHLEPEILVVDEVLAVGDAAFQRKCLGKMEAVAKQGRTVLFVSHNMAAIKTLCNRGILLEAGKIILDGSSGDAITKYLAGGNPSANQSLAERTDRLGNGKLKFTEFQFLNKNGEPISEITSGDELTLCAKYETTTSIDHTRIIIAFSFWDQYKNPVAGFASDEMGSKFNTFGSVGSISIKIPQLLLRGGHYSIQLLASHLTTAPDNFLDLIENASSLTVLPGDFWRSGHTNRSGAYCLIDARMTNF